MRKDLKFGHQDLSCLSTGVTYSTNTMFHQCCLFYQYYLINYITYSTIVSFCQYCPYWKRLYKWYRLYTTCTIVSISIIYFHILSWPPISSPISFQPALRHHRNIFLWPICPIVFCGVIEKYIHGLSAMVRAFTYVKGCGFLSSFVHRFHCVL